ncbi:DUF4179 domain-containing protein [Ktedonobacteria bacterium brp13]|nr:DUF4179 domain-containing protein [Ktedonobacteria bacterium brp13]
MSSKERFDDIFDGCSDQMLEQLEAVYQASTPPVQLNWGRFQMQMHKPLVESKRPWYSSMRFPVAGTRRASLAMSVAVLCMLMIVGGSVVYASGGLPAILQSIFNWSPTTKTLLAQQQMTTLNQTFTSDGYTLTLQNGYADTNEVILGVSLALPPAPKSQNWLVNSMQLTTSQGTKLPFITSSNVFNAVEKTGKLNAFIYTFDGAAIASNQNQLALHLEVPVKCTDQQIIPPNCTGTAKFDFTLPFHAGHTVAPQQSVNRNGKNFTLHKVVFASSETRLYISGFSQYYQGPYSIFSKRFKVTLSNGKKTISYSCIVDNNLCLNSRDLHAGFVVIQNLEPGHKVENGLPRPSASFALTQRTYGAQGYYVMMPPAFTNEHGDWTVTVTQLAAPVPLPKNDPNRGTGPGYVSTNSPDPSVKPWVFTFHMP